MLTAMICNGAGNYTAWIHRFYRYRGYATQLAPTSGSMGYGVPAAVAAALAGLAPCHPLREGRPPVFSAPSPRHLRTYALETLAEPGTNLRATACQARAQNFLRIENFFMPSDVEPYLTP